jgi:hypothetical protein
MFTFIIHQENVKNLSECATKEANSRKEGVLCTTKLRPGESFVPVHHNKTKAKGGFVIGGVADEEGLVPLSQGNVLGGVNWLVGTMDGTAEVSACKGDNEK